MSFDPGKVMAEVEEGAGRLEAAADQLTEAIEKFETLEQDYEYAMAVERTKVYHDDSYPKPPAEDVRNSLALQRIDKQLRLDYGAAKANKEALSVRYRALAAAVSARQSLLKALA